MLFSLQKHFSIFFACLLPAFLCIGSLPAYAQPVAASKEDTVYIKVHFLYGSKPFKKYRDTERRWFGGILGGHVGIEADSGRILNFRPNGKFHVFTSNKNRHSHYEEHNFSAFYALFGSNPDSVKKVIVTIPVTVSQKEKFDSISSAYLQQTPYDYALFGMRCGAATYEILGQLGILKDYAYSKTYKKIFYPQKLRKRLLTRAEKNNWSIERYNGSTRRKWERD